MEAIEQSPDLQKLERQLRTVAKFDELCQMADNMGLDRKNLTTHDDIVEMLLDYAKKRPENRKEVQENENKIEEAREDKNTDQQPENKSDPANQETKSSQSPELNIPPTNQDEWDALKDALARGASVYELEKWAKLKLQHSTSTTYTYYATPDRLAPESPRYPLDGSDFVVFKPKKTHPEGTFIPVLFPGLHVHVTSGKKSIPGVLFLQVALIILAYFATVIFLSGPVSHIGNPSAIVCQTTNNDQRPVWI